MNEIPIWAGIGMLATIILLIAIIITIVDGARTALIVIIFTILLTAVVAGICLFWAWIGGVLA